MNGNELDKLALAIEKNDPFLAREIAEDEDENLPEEYKKLAYQNFKETDEIRNHRLEEFRHRVQAKGWNVPDKRAFYIKFLRAGNLTADGAMNVLLRYLQMKSDFPRYFKDAMPDLIQPIAQQKLHTILPHRDKYGRRIAIFRAGAWDPSKVKFYEAFRFAIMVGELIALEPKTQVAGVTLIANAEGFGFKQFRNVSIEDLKAFACVIHESFPLWFRGLHVYNAPRFFSLAFNLIRPFLSQDVVDTIRFHSSLSTLHDEVSPELLPECLGGSDGVFDNDACNEALFKIEDILKEIHTMNFDSGTKIEDKQN